MKQLNRRGALKFMAATVGVGGTSSSVQAAQPETHDHATSNRNLIPQSLKAEHDELHEELARAISAGGETEKAARAVAKVLHPHFVKEEKLAMPPLGLLADLADGRVKPEMEKFVKLTDDLKSQLPEMLKEHARIVAALDSLSEASLRENKPRVQHFAERLKQHAKTEEEVLYPAAILVGEYLKLTLPR